MDPTDLSRGTAVALRSLTPTASWWSNKRSGRIFGKGSGTSGLPSVTVPQVMNGWWMMVDDGGWWWMMGVEGIISFLCMFLAYEVSQPVFPELWSTGAVWWSPALALGSSARDTYGHGPQTAAVLAAPTVRASLHKRPQKSSGGFVFGKYLAVVGRRFVSPIQWY